MLTKTGSEQGKSTYGSILTSQFIVCLIIVDVLWDRFKNGSICNN